MQTLNATKSQLEMLSKQYDELEAKSKADVKVLVKEVKSLRNSHTELKKELIDSMKEKCEAEVYYHLNIYIPLERSYSFKSSCFMILDYLGK